MRDVQLAHIVHDKVMSENCEASTVLLPRDYAVVSQLHGTLLPGAQVGCKFLSHIGKETVQKICTE